MGNTASNPKITSHDKAILNLKIQRDRLSKSRQQLQKVIDRETEIARECIKSNHIERAKLALRKKKRQQSLLNNLERQSDTLEELIDTIEFKLIEKDVLYGLEQGNKVLKEINKEMSLEKVEKILDETSEGIHYQNELSERLGSLLTNGEEDEVEDELKQLEIEMGAIPPNVVVVDENRPTVEDVERKHKLESLPQVPKQQPQSNGDIPAKNVDNEEFRTAGYAI